MKKKNDDIEDALYWLLMTVLLVVVWQELYSMAM